MVQNWTMLGCSNRRHGGFGHWPKARLMWAGLAERTGWVSAGFLRFQIGVFLPSAPGASAGSSADLPAPPASGHRAGCRKTFRHLPYLPRARLAIAREVGRCSARRLLMDDRLEGCPDLRPPCRSIAMPDFRDQYAHAREAARGWHTTPTKPPARAHHEHHSA